MNQLQVLLGKAQLLPEESGCYLMKDHRGQVIYVGKAKRLKQRVTSYFNQSVKSVKTEFLVQNITDFEFLITRSEAESYILENNLIKEHNPKYNIRLRDDKSYPYVEVNFGEEFPRLEFIRRPKKEKKKELFGPFPLGSGLSEVLRILTKAFKLRDCSLYEFKQRKNPCLLYQMHQCSAPCVKEISIDDYQVSLKLALDVLSGGQKASKSLKYLKNEMLQASEQEEYESASMINQHIQTLEYFLDQVQSQAVESLKEEKNVDVWGLFEGEEEIDLSLYQVRKGNLLGQKNFHFAKKDLVQSAPEELSTFVLQYYSASIEPIADHVILNFLSEVEDFKIALTEMTGHPVQVWNQKRKYEPLIEMSQKHAEECQRIRLADRESLFNGLKKLKDLLNLPSLPQHLECYDVAIWQGQSPTASQVVFKDGKLDKKLYRYYHLHELPEGNNDFAMMREVISRRMDNGELPDVLVIDGGVAQVNTVVAVLAELKVSLPVVGIAKSKDIHRGNFKKEAEHTAERLFIPGRLNPYILEKEPALMKIIVSLRDEAHRFSRKLHHKTEKARLFQSWVDEISGIGPKIKQKILTKMDMTKEELEGLSTEEIKEKFEITGHQASLIKAHLNMIKIN
jgi:excinuclease ABC subunit C